MNNPERAQLTDGEKLLYLSEDEAFKLLIAGREASIESIAAGAHQRFNYVSYEEALGHAYSILYKALRSVRKNNKVVHSLYGFLRFSLINGLNKYAKTKWVRNRQTEVALEDHPEAFMEQDVVTERPNETVERIEAIQSVRDLLSKVLTEDEIDIILLKFDHREMTDRERAKYLGRNSRGALLRAERRIFKKIKAYIGRQGLTLDKDF